MIIENGTNLETPKSDLLEVYNRREYVRFDGRLICLDIQPVRQVEGEV